VVGAGFAQAAFSRALMVWASTNRRNQMPIILWLLGVPLTLVLLLMLFGVF
jgi:hypothetical protein